MFWHNFKYSLKTLFKSKALIFWTFIFPILLGTFFKLAFSNIEKNESLNVFDIAVVNNEDFKNNTFFKEALRSLSDDNNKDKLFNISYLSLDECKKLLNNNKITGYLLFSGDDIKINVNSDGINQTVLRYVVSEIDSSRLLVNRVMLDNISIGVNDILSNNSSSIKDVSNSNLSYTMIEFYSLIAMACLYGSMLSMYIINSKLPNMRDVGKRCFVSPLSKGKLVVSSLFASYLVQIVGLTLLFLYTIFILNVDYGKSLCLSIFLALIGAFAGLCLGLMVSSTIKAKEGSKIGILISITMIYCFLSGMMGVGMKYVIDSNVPILNKINPVAMITDGFYSLYYFNTLDRFYFNIISLIIYSLILIIISILALRRQKYDSI